MDIHVSGVRSEVCISALLEVKLTLRPDVSANKLFGLSCVAYAGLHCGLSKIVDHVMDAVWSLDRHAEKHTKPKRRQMLLAPLTMKLAWVRPPTAWMPMVQLTMFVSRASCCSWRAASPLNIRRMKYNPYLQGRAFPLRSLSHFSSKPHLHPPDFQQIRISSCTGT